MSISLTSLTVTDVTFQWRILAYSSTQVRKIKT